MSRCVHSLHYALYNLYCGGDSLMNPLSPMCLDSEPTQLLPSIGQQADVFGGQQGSSHFCREGCADPSGTRNVATGRVRRDYQIEKGQHVLPQEPPQVVSRWVTLSISISILCPFCKFEILSSHWALVRDIEGRSAGARVQEQGQSASYCQGVLYPKYLMMTMRTDYPSNIQISSLRF